MHINLTTMHMIKNTVHQLKVIYKTGKNIKITPHRLNMVQKAIQYITNEKVPGDYMEFGVAEGRTFAGASVLARKFNAPIRMFRAYDSFEGFPELHEVDKKFERFKTGQEKWPMHHFDATLKKADVNRDTTEVVSGWFNESLNADLHKKYHDENVKASIVWIDCDLYGSAIEVLKFITPYLQNGTVIIFDDWYCYHADPNKGEMRAAREWLDSQPQISLIQYHRYGIVGNSFIVNVAE